MSIEEFLGDMQRYHSGRAAMSNGAEEPVGQLRSLLYRIHNKIAEDYGLALLGNDYVHVLDGLVNLFSESAEICEELADDTSNDQHLVAAGIYRSAVMELYIFMVG